MTFNSSEAHPYFDTGSFRSRSIFATISVEKDVVEGADADGEDEEDTADEEEVEVDDEAEEEEAEAAGDEDIEDTSEVDGEFECHELPIQRWTDERSEGGEAESTQKEF